jgi:hypothetical protein
MFWKNLKRSLFGLFIFFLFIKLHGRPVNNINFETEHRLLWVYISQNHKQPLKKIKYSSRVKKRLKKTGWTQDRTDYKIPRELISRVAECVDSIRHCSRILRALSVKASYSQYLELLELAFVEKIEPVKIYKRKQDSTFSLKKNYLARVSKYGHSYTQLEQIGIPALHEYGLTGKGVRIALLDAGFNKHHEVFQEIIKEDRLIAERDFIFGDHTVVNENHEDSIYYQDGHGTAVWSLIGAYHPYTMIGGAYNAEFLLGKTERIKSETRIEEDNFIAGIEWADSLGADIISTSLGYRDFDDFEYQFEDLDGHTARTTKAVNWASERGILCVTSAGNERTRFKRGGLITPGDSPSAITVGAVDSSGIIAYFSSHGPTADGRIKPDLCAMGVNNFVAISYSPSSYSIGSGTSYSAPLITAGCALLLEQFPDWSPEIVLNELKNHASRSGNPDMRYGWGIPDFFSTLWFNKRIPEITRGTAKNTIVCAPNPVASSATFYYHNPDSVLTSNSSLNIYNLYGQKIYSREIDKLVPIWNLRDYSGKRVAAGIYLVEIESRELQSKIGKLSVIF